MEENVRLGFPQMLGGGILDFREALLRRGIDLESDQTFGPIFATARKVAALIEENSYTSVGKQRVSYHFKNEFNCYRHMVLSSSVVEIDVSSRDVDLLAEFSYVADNIQQAAPTMLMGDIVASGHTLRENLIQPTQGAKRVEAEELNDALSHFNRERIFQRYGYRPEERSPA